MRMTLAQHAEAAAQADFPDTVVLVYENTTPGHNKDYVIIAVTTPGQLAMVSSYGPIGGRKAVRQSTFDSRRDLLLALEAKVDRRIRHGYTLVDHVRLLNDREIAYMALGKSADQREDYFSRDLYEMGQAEAHVRHIART